MSKHRNRHVSYDEDEDDGYLYEEEDEDEDGQEFMYRRRTSSAVSDRATREGWFASALKATETRNQQQQQQQQQQQRSTPGKGTSGPGDDEEYDPGEVHDELACQVLEQVENIVGEGSFSYSDCLDSVVATGGRSLEACVSWLLDLRARLAEKKEKEKESVRGKGVMIDLTAAWGSPSPNMPAANRAGSAAPSGGATPGGGGRSGGPGEDGDVIMDDDASPDVGFAGPGTPTSSAGGSTPSLAAASRPAVMPRQAEKRVKGAEKEMEEALAGPGKEHLTLVVIGHVDAGKSTLMGHLLLKLAAVSAKLIQKFEKESRDMGKESFKYAWVMDEGAEERERGITMDVGVSHFETAGKQFTLLDAPGHRDFVPNMISGASQADVALLVVDSSAGEFEAGFMNGGQTKEHIVLAKALGVGQLVVAVNKLDTCTWAKARYDEIMAQLQGFLKGAGFASARFVPVSGFLGENITERREPLLMDWYSGPTLAQALDTFAPVTRDLDRPLRFGISDVARVGTGTITVAGKVEAGKVCVGDKLAIMPAGEVASVKGIEIRGESLRWCAAGQSALLTIAGVDKTVVRVGSVLCDPQALVPVTRTIRARLITTHDLTVPIIHGTAVLFYSQSAQEPAVISKIEALVNRATGEIASTNPRALGPNLAADVKITLDNPCPLELFSSSKQLGRFTLRRGATTVAAGIVTAIIDAKP